MLCVTGNESTTAALADRLNDRAGAAHLAEVRVDALAQINEPLYQLLAQHRRRLVVCCRPKDQGGSFTGSIIDRLAVLHRLAALDLAYLDLEDDLPDDQYQALRNRHSGKVIRSWHDFTRFPADLARRAQAMGSRADLFKLAVAVEDAAELTALRALAPPGGQRGILIGMGSAGMLTRCRYPRFWLPVDLRRRK